MIRSQRHAKNPATMREHFTRVKLFRSRAWTSREPVPIFELLREVLLGDEADALREEGVDLHLETVFECRVDLALPFFVGKPRVRFHLFRASDVFVAQRNLDGLG